ncbi:hypothetical protein F2P81_021573 [Scophthalmus maximus]|uniref:C-type lectin domain-containing protein n=1 Tax=Scophthalmus maximus TaxID=52904 RepID=A0A6A4RVQ9_SCOMX|nr:hypothetical protein F2P81_021573 [Scophthalmus maximus]
MEEIYANVDYVKPVGLRPSTNQTNRDSAAEHLAVRENLTERLQASENKTSSLSREIERLQTLSNRGQPDNGGGHPKYGEEDCAVITANRGTDENWNDLRCDASRPWICEKNAN